MIQIKNRQKKIKVNEKKLKIIISKILDILDYSDFDIGIWLTTNQTIHKYNKKYRKKNKPTDILSFPFHSKITPGKKIIPKTDDDKNLGDIIISLEHAKKDATNSDNSLDKQLKILLVHGICHLIGYDHTTDKDYRKMQKQEAYLLESINQ